MTGNGTDRSGSSQVQGRFGKYSLALICTKSFWLESTYNTQQECPWCNDHCSNYQSWQHLVTVEITRLAGGILRSQGCQHQALSEEEEGIDKLVQSPRWVTTDQLFKRGELHDKLLDSPSLATYLDQAPEFDGFLKDTERGINQNKTRFCYRLRHSSRKAIRLSL